MTNIFAFYSRRGQMLTRLVVLIAALFMAGTAGSAQTATGRIILATVTDSRGQPVTSLTEDDFVVHEGGEPREVLSARLADYPVVVLVDNGGAGGADLDAIRSAAGRFVARLGRGRAVAVGPLADPAMPLTSFEAERALVASALDGLGPAPSDASLFVQAIAHAAGAIRATEAPFSAIGVFAAADLEAPVPAAAAVLTPVLAGRTAVHVVARTTAPGRGAAAGTLGDTMRVLSEQSRGQFTPIYSGVSYQAALDRLADRLAAEMIVEFLVPPGVAAGGDVKVGVRIPGARVMGLGVSR
jgi:hypothetical protein